MFTGQVATISNQATWPSAVFELIDEDDGSTVDLSDPALTVDISVTIKGLRYFNSSHNWTDYGEQLNWSGYPLATASLSNGKAFIVGPGFQWQFEVADLSCLCPGTYRLGAKITINAVVIDLIDGTIAVVEGN